jgi:hypothetical protein
MAILNQQVSIPNRVASQYCISPNHSVFVFPAKLFYFSLEKQLNKNRFPVAKPGMGYQYSKSRPHGNGLRWRQQRKESSFFLGYKKILLLNNVQASRLVLIRPLLHCFRFDLRNLCSVWKLPVYPDKTNQMVYHPRNRLRKQVIPLLRYYFNPGVDKLLFQFAEIITRNSCLVQHLSKINSTSHTWSGRPYTSLP